jgi:hypothetical protein
MGSFQFWGDAQNFQRQLRERFAQPIIALLGGGAANASSSKRLMSMLEGSMREVGLS